MDVFNNNGEVYEYENACDLPPAAETVVAVTRVVEEESRDVFNSNGEVYENACDLPPAAETVVAVTRVVEEESRDVRDPRLLPLTVEYSATTRTFYSYRQDKSV